MRVGVGAAMHVLFAQLGAREQRGWILRIGLVQGAVVGHDHDVEGFATDQRQLVLVVVSQAQSRRDIGYVIGQVLDLLCFCEQFTVCLAVYAIQGGEGGVANNGDSVELSGEERLRSIRQARGARRGVGI
jgi:hypothetical protein